MAATTLAFLGGSIGGWELLVVAVVILIFFGPKAIPDMARTIGKISAQLRGAAQDFRAQIEKSAEEPAEADKAPPAGAVRPADSVASKPPEPGKVEGGRDGMSAGGARDERPG